MRSLLRAVVLTSAIGLTCRVAGASPQARLVYSRGSGAEGCADEAALRRAVSARIGYDPFFPWAPKTVVAVVFARAGRLVARVELVGDDARSEGSRELDVASADCSPLIDTLALTISIAIDPHALARPASTTVAVEERPPASTAPSPSPSPPPAADTPAAPPKEVPPERAVRVQLAADVRLALGNEPAAAPGVAIRGALVWPLVSLALEGATHVPTSVDVPAGGRAEGWIAAASFVPCLRLGMVRACGVTTLGRFEGSASGVPSPETHASIYAALGFRGGLEVPLGERLALDAHADFLLNAIPATLRVGQGDIWTAWRVSGTLALGASTTF